jgi:ABC-type branched-subunit amino acid transport system ATPase component
MKPKILLLDEPAAGMNNEETEDIARFILDIHEELEITVVLIDHDMNMVMDIATEVIVMDFGKKLFDGDPKYASITLESFAASLGSPSNNFFPKSITITFLEGVSPSIEVIVMDFGKKLFDGDPKEAAKDSSVIEAYLGVSD